MTPALHLTTNLPPGVTLPMDTEHPVLALAPVGARLFFVGEEHGRRRLYMRELAEAAILFAGEVLRGLVKQGD